jgi:hypothetical protein
MAAQTSSAEQTRQLLWSHAARQIVVALPATSSYECVPVGYGWGLRSRADGSHALVIHPSSNAREVGDLALTASGAGTRVIPRRQSSFIEYLHTVAGVVAATLNSSA